MKCCGILTFQFAHNYGAQLQGYALKHYIETNYKDFNVDIINYAADQNRVDYQLFKCKKKKIVPILREFKRAVLRIPQYHLFKKFAKCFLGVDIANPMNNLQTIASHYSYIIVGSDQVWNKNITKTDESYLLKNICCEKKLAYSASFGNWNLEYKFNDKEIKLLNEFNNISLREKNALQYVQEVTLNNVLQTVDPVFLLTKDDWLCLEKKNSKLPENYIAFCILNKDLQLTEQAVQLQLKLNLPVFSIHPVANKQKYGRQLYNVGPQEYLQFISNATIVITNSFHAVAFSILYRKKVVCNNITHGDSRIRELLELCGYTMTNEMKVIDTSQLEYSELEKRIEISKEYLKTALS